MEGSNFTISHCAASLSQMSWKTVPPFHDCCCMTFVSKAAVGLSHNVYSHFRKLTECS